MTVDHSAFVARHHTPPRPPEPTRGSRRFLRALLIFLASIGYLAFCLVLAVTLHLDGTMVTGVALLFLAAFAGGLLMQRLLHVFTAQERERLLLREVIEGSRGARLITDGADNTVLTNGRFDSLCSGVGTPSLSTFTRLFVDNPEAVAHFRGLAEQARRGLTDSIELKAQRGDRELWLQVTAQPVAGWAGYIHWRVDDVTGQREIDRSLSEEREKLIDFTDNAPVGFFSVDEDGRFVFVNATFARWLGEDIGALLREGRLHTWLVEPPKDAAPYDIMPGGGARQVTEIRMKGPAGRTFLASVSQTVVRDATGLLRTRGVVHDLTAERAMRQALQASEDRFRRFFEEAPLGIALVDSDRVIKDANAAFSAMLGEDIPDVEGRGLLDLLEAEDRDQVMLALSRIDQGQIMQSPIEVRLRGNKGVVVAQLFARGFRESGNIVLHFIDVTQQKVLETQFVQSQKMQAIGQLAGGIAHDFNNLLTAMIGFCDLLLLRHKPGDPSFADIMQIKQNANRAANLVRQLLAFSRQQTLQPRVHDITDILTEVSHLLRRLIGANIALDVVHGQDLGLVRVDEGQMEQVLINLAVNARDAMESGGSLRISTGNVSNAKPLERGGDKMPPGEWVMIEVADSGCGIPAENLARIFEPFFTTKGVGQGTGLGLATVYGIIRQTGGYLHVDSEIGKGTTFSIYLPRLSETDVAQAEEKPQLEEATGDLTGTARILLVEDEDAVRVFGTRALTNKGYEVLSATNGEDALRVMSTGPGAKIDLLITDVVMPNMDGPTLAQRLRQSNPSLKIIFVSGYTEDRLKEHMGKNIYFLPKPFTLKQLAAKVKEVLDA